ncbi:MAG: hypothetical protein HC881_09060, partial [Leptolyngbyaceae cyanobacterium SL_7_1]|nr:hypothetical protein [Leptolyngbyaceae cyanobacterium SL_7_1]
MVSLGVSLGMNRCLWQRLGSGMIVLMTVLSGSLAAEASPGMDAALDTPEAAASLPVLLPIEQDNRIAQFFPSIPDNRRLISVLGNGQASAPADYAGIQWCLAQETCTPTQKLL